MKYIKRYENIGSNIKVGDYVLIKSKFSTQKLRNFINNNIGLVTANANDSIIRVKYTKIPFEIKSFFDKDSQRFFQIDHVAEYDKDIEILKLKISANKYNI